MAKKYMCVDVGGTFIKYAVIDSELNFHAKGKTDTPKEGIEAYLDALTAVCKPHLAEISGLAMSVPGVIDSENGVCRTGGLLHYVKEFPLADEMQKRIGTPVTVMNDAKSAALAESTWGSLAGCQDAIVIVLGTGVGGALVKDGKVHMGKHFSAGEFGRVMFGQDLDLRESCWARHNGNARLLNLAAAIKGVPADSITTYDLFQWIEAGDEDAMWVLDKYTKDLAYIIMNLQTIYDPELFAIGGGISQQPLLFTYLKRNVTNYKKICPLPIPEPQITACKYFNDANLIGALGYHLSRYAD